MSLRTGSRLGPYTLINKLGKGGQGQVWLVEDRTELVEAGELAPFSLPDAPQFALKVCLDLDDFPGSVLPKNIQNEMANWVKLSNKKHPNILPIIKPAVYEKLVVLVSEYAPDGTLRDWLKARKGKPLSWEEATELMVGILAGLAFLHQHRIIHRDLKPENVVMQGSLPRLMDFGLSRNQVDSLNQSRPMGTPDYMPPEAFKGKRSLAWDIWSVGVLFQELLTGQRPFPRTAEESDDVVLMQAICDRPPTPLPSPIPPPLRHLIEQTLTKDQEQRKLLFPDAHALYTALLQCRDTILTEQRLQPMTELREQLATLEQTHRSEKATLQQEHDRLKQASEQAHKRIQDAEKRVEEAQRQAREAQQSSAPPSPAITPPPRLFGPALALVNTSAVLGGTFIYTLSSSVTPVMYSLEGLLLGSIGYVSYCHMKNKRLVQGKIAPIQPMKFQSVKSSADQSKFKRYLRAAKAGSAGDMTNLGYMYQMGNGVTKDSAEALKWYRKAAEAGDAQGMSNLGYMYQNGHGVTQDNVEALKWYRKAAEAGNAQGMTNLGYMYENGHGVTQDYSEAVKWYRKAAETDPAQGTNLGYMYDEGHGVAQDYSEALKWYRKAAEAGEAQGMSNLGYMYEMGNGVAQDYSEALKWYRKAAEAGNAQGMTNLGYMYENGHGVTQDYSEAVKWYRKAAETDPAQGTNLGYMYDEGQGVAQDYSEALKWYRKAAEAGNAQGMNNLGWMYEDGHGVTKDLEIAKEWYRKAAKAGNEEAQENLKRLGGSVP